MRIRKIRTYSLAAVAAIALGAFFASGAQAEGFTEGQAADGKAKYEQNCQRCHAADLTGNGPFPPLTGDRFMSRWGSRTSAELFNFISTRMPRDRPGQLAKADYVEIVAYWLSFHGKTAGGEALTEGAAVSLQ
jgi:mono/diheme cytochrome c family protein